MATTPALLSDWIVTREKVDELLRRIVQVSDPLQIVLFGSRARGDHRPDSDIDLAIILDCPEEEVRQRLPQSVLQGIHMEVTFLPVSKTKYEEFRPWINSVYNFIATEGIVLYDRKDPESARPDALRQSAER